METGIIIGIIIAIIAVAIIVRNNIVRHRAKKAPKLSSEEYIKQNFKKP